MPWTTITNGLREGWSSGAPADREPVYLQGWWATTNRGLRIDASGTVGITSVARYPRDLELAATAMVDMAWSQIESRSVALGVTHSMVVNAVARQLSAYGVTASVAMSMEASTGWDFVADALADIAISAVARYQRDVDMAATVSQSITALARYARDMAAETYVAHSITAWQSEPRGVDVGTSVANGMSAYPRMFSGYGVPSAVSMAMAAEIPYHAPQLVTVTASGRTEVPWWARYISAVVLGGGAGGRKGGLGEGKGGKNGNYTSHTWDRNTFPAELGSMNVSIGSGGGGDANGGGTQLWIDDYATTGYSGEYIVGAGGSGGGDTVNTGGPGNHSHGGINAVGGTGNGSVPGSGGKGGSAFYGGGSSGARGQAWLRFYM